MDIETLLGQPSPIAVTAETKCIKDSDCAITKRCCDDYLTNKKHAGTTEQDCGIKKCPAMVAPKMVAFGCCANACTPFFKKGQTCPP
jgi:hypothetical protein